MNVTEHYKIACPVIRFSTSPYEPWLSLSPCNVASQSAPGSPLYQSAVAMASLLQLLPCLLLVCGGAAVQEPYQKEILTSLVVKLAEMHEQLEKLESKNTQMEKKASAMEEKMEHLEARNAQLTNRLKKVKL